MNRVTIKDIAAKAGVANSTVTNALNPESKKISDEKRAEILAIVDEMGYTPLRSAQSLSAKGKCVIGFFMRASSSFSDGLINQKLIYYLNKYAHQSNLEIVTIIISHNEELGYKEITKSLHEYEFSHLIIHGLDADEYIINQLATINIPKILIEVPIVNESTQYISTDNFRAQFELTKRVIAENDVNRILYLTGYRGAYVSIERENGFKAAMKQTNIEYDIIECSFEKPQILPIIEKIDFSQYDYVSCGSDIIAAESARFCHQSGLENIVFSGFDGVDYLSYFDYKIYTVYQKINELSQEIIDMAAEGTFQTKLVDFDIITNH